MSTVSLMQCLPTYFWYVSCCSLLPNLETFLRETIHMYPLDFIALNSILSEWESSSSSSAIFYVGRSMY